MAQELDDLAKSCEAFLLSIDEGRYYDAHEDLEEIWYPRRFENNDEVRLWKGFINAAVSFELIKRGRPGPSRKAWATYQKYFLLMKGMETPYYPIYVKMVLLIEKIHKGEHDVRILECDGVPSCLQTVRYRKTNSCRAV